MKPRTTSSGTWTSRQLRQGLRRRNVIAALFLSVFLVFSGRLVYVQAVEGPRLADEALQGRLRSYTIPSPRGEIVDTDGEILATSAQRYNIGVNQVKVATFVHEVAKDGKDGKEDKEVVGTGAEEAADLLAPLLGRDPAELGGQMVGSSTFVYLAKGLTPTQWREIRDLDIPGIEPEPVTERIYPNGSTAGNILGFVGRDGGGLAGLELAYNDDLVGADGSETVEIGAGGQVIPTGTYRVTEPEPGDTLHLTIDRDVQFVAQEALDATVAKYGAQWAGIAVMEIGTGRLLVLADSGAVDPGNVQATPERERGARTVSAPYEPGSTGKLLTLSAAVDQGLVDASTVFTVPERITIDGQTFKDAEPHPTYQMTVAGILAMSSNVGTVQVGNLMSDDARYQYMLNYGFGAKTGIELPGESAGILYEPGDWDGRTRMTTMFGQGYAVTLVQNVAVAATLGNGGTWVAPYLVDSVEHGDGSVTVHEPAETRDVVSPATADLMVAMMEGVVQEGGTAPRAAIDGYRVAGKTGTAQTADANGQLTSVVANFVGIVPADNPRFAVAVAVYRPTSGFYGGTIAAPIFKEVAEFALHNAGVEPSSGTPAEFPWIIE